MLTDSHMNWGKWRKMEGSSVWPLHYHGAQVYEVKHLEWFIFGGGYFQFWQRVITGFDRVGDSLLHSRGIIPTLQALAVEAVVT